MAATITVLRPAAILVDLDGTLLDTEVGARAAVAATGREAFERFGIEPKQWETANSSAFGAVWAPNAQNWVLGSVSSAELSEAMYAQTLQMVGADPSLAWRFAELHARIVAQAASLYADTRPFLTAVAFAGIPLALVTNGGSSQRDILDAMGVTSYFSHIYVSAERGIAKPDPLVFTRVCEALDAEPTQCWHIGDSLSSDIAGALSADLTAIWINRTPTASPTRPRPSRTISSLDQLARALTRA